jgi:HEPN domain-containing protein
VTNSSLAASSLIKARARLKTLPILMQEHAWSDVISEAQEIVELALKGMLRHAGVEPPHWHDVGGFLLENRGRFANEPEAQRALDDATVVVAAANRAIRL